MRLPWDSFSEACLDSASSSGYTFADVTATETAAAVEAVVVLVLMIL